MEQDKTAIERRDASPLNGTIPPPERRFGAGPLANRPGRPANCGSTLIEWINSFAYQEFTADDLRRIIKDSRTPKAKQAAADMMLRLGERADMADFEPLLDGQMSLRELKASGVDTAMVKKTKTKTRRIPQGDGEPIVETEREVELHDRALAAWRDVVDDTNGKPTQSVNVSSDIQVATVHVVYQKQDQNGRPIIEVAGESKEADK